MARGKLKIHREVQHKDDVCIFRRRSTRVQVKEYRECASKRDADCDGELSSRISITGKQFLVCSRHSIELDIARYIFYSTLKKPNGQKVGLQSIAM